ncbi:MAG: helix-turn-helix domain-containing protein [Bifidobacteriaceae bacterium]|nr:helix-turn-helix domain-containing protein [Bifidobacteriaceae bacterium]
MRAAPPAPPLPAPWPTLSAAWPRPPTATADPPTGLSQTRISEIVRGKRAITADTALRLSRALGVDEGF